MGLFMGIFLHGYFRPFIFFRVPIVFALAPRWVREQCGQAPGRGLTGIFPGSLLLSIPEQRRLSYAQAVLGVSLFEPFHLLSGLPGSAAGGIAHRPLGRVLARAVGWVRLRVTRIAGMHFSRSSEGGGISPFRCPPEKGAG